MDAEGSQHLADHRAQHPEAVTPSQEASAASQAAVQTQVDLAGTAVVQVGHLEDLEGKAAWRREGRAGQGTQGEVSRLVGVEERKEGIQEAPSREGRREAS